MAILSTLGKMGVADNNINIFVAADVDDKAISKGKNQKHIR
jgi:hypothetical protein